MRHKRGEYNTSKHGTVLYRVYACDNTYDGESYSVNQEYWQLLQVAHAATAPDEAIIHAMKRVGFLKQHCRFSIMMLEHVDGVPDSCYIEYRKTGETVAHLIQEDWKEIGHGTDIMHHKTRVAYTRRQRGARA